MNLKQLSLTARMSLMFMFAVVTVLVIAGLSFNMFSQHHFESLDRQVLAEKLQSANHILGNVHDKDNLSDELPQLQALLGAHQELAAAIIAANGRTLFSDPAAVDIPQDFRLAKEQTLWEWRSGDHLYRGMTGRITVPALSGPLTAIIMLDVTRHAHFFETLQLWFWIGLTVSALVSAILGWAVARSGLQPLRQVTQLAQLMSARSLQERIPLGPVPLELQQLVLSFNAMLSRLEESFVRLSNFSADIAHELRTPVTNLMTHTEVVLTKKRDVNAYEENLYSNLEELKRMSRMIDDMLFLAKADNGLITLERSRVELGDVVTKLFDFYSLMAEERNVVLSLKGVGLVLGDRPMLSRAISNLLTNALRYTPPGEAIRVFIEQAENVIILSVENPGRAIDAEHLGSVLSSRSRTKGGLAR